MTDLQRINMAVKPAPANVCIYCDAAEPEAQLTDEHIIPYSLGGNYVLPKASCQRCAKETARMEGYCARQIFQDVRLKHGLQTRRPKERPTHLPILNTFEPSPEAAIPVLVPVKEHPGYLLLVTPAPPGILVGREPNAPTPFIPFIRRISDDGSGKEKLYREIKPDPVLRMIAKIALGFAASVFDADSFITTVRDVILGTDPHISYWVGGTTREMDEFPPPNGNGVVGHRSVAYHQDISGEPHLLVQVQLFAYLNTPIFTVVVGKIADSSGLQG